MIRDDRDELITALIRKLGGEAKISEREMMEADECTIEMSLDLDGAAIYRVYHPNDRRLHVKATSIRLRTDLPHGPVTSVDTTRCIRCGEVWPCPGEGQGVLLALEGSTEDG